jgi:hypothetical protein
MVLRKIDTEVPPFSVTGLSPSLVDLSSIIHLRGDFVTLHGLQSDRTPIPCNTRIATRLVFNTMQVWAIPLSLAAT